MRVRLANRDAIREKQVIKTAIIDNKNRYYDNKNRYYGNKNRYYYRNKKNEQKKNASLKRPPGYDVNNVMPNGRLHKNSKN